MKTVINSTLKHLTQNLATDQRKSAALNRYPVPGRIECGECDQQIFRSGFYQLLRKPIGDVRDAERHVIA
ncbi:MAG: hypothetical protein ABSC55_21395, partial [Syntrophorhabdales bacterium]